MKKILSLTVVGLMIATMILYANPTSTASHPPTIGVNECPWGGCPDDLIDFWAQVYFLGYPPYDWVWTFTKTGGTGLNEFERTNTSTDPYWGFNETFEFGCNYTVEIEVTNDIGQKAIWPSPDMVQGLNHVVVFDGDLRCIPDPWIEPILLRKGWYRVYVLGQNIGECTCKKSWNTHIYWFGIEDEIADDTYPYDLDSGDYLGDPFPWPHNYIIEFARQDKIGGYWIKICLDADDERYEEDEGNNCIWKWYFFWW